MRDVWDFLRAISKKHTELLTGSLIAVYLAVQPYTSFLPPPPSKVFWGIVAFAGAVASFRAWRDERRGQIEAEALLMQNNSIPEDPHVAITAKWPQDDPNSGPMEIIARNRGKQPLRSFQIKAFPLGLHSITFIEVPELRPDTETVSLIEFPEPKTQQ